MIYKKHELSKSLNGNKIVHIARNASGNVIFRESSEERLRSAIDQSVEIKQRQEELEIKQKTEHEAKKKERREKRALFAPKVEEPEIPEVEETPLAAAVPIAENVSEVLPEPQPIHIEQKTQVGPIKRGPDGKFISKSQVGEPQDEIDKKSFWKRLTE